MLALSLTSALVMALLPLGDAFVISYGLDRVRFPAPLLVGSQVRLWAELREIKPGTSAAQLTVDVRLESRDQEKSVCAARYLFIVHRIGGSNEQGR